MKKFILSVLMLLSLLTTSIAQEGFKITGQLGGTLGGNLFLIAKVEQGTVKLGETVMTNGNFEFKGSVSGLTVAYIKTAENKTIATLMLENRDFTLRTGEYGIVVEGGEAQKVLNEFNAINKKISREKFRMKQEARAAYAQQNQMKMQSLQQQFQKMMEEVQVKQEKLMKIHKDSPVAAFMVASTMFHMDFELLTESFNSLGENAKKSSFGKDIQIRLKQLSKVVVGAIAPNFKATTQNNDTLSLYEIKAKVKLVDFWASWCQPCRQEMSHLRKIYQKYHKKGLEIIGFSLDKKKQDWVKAIQDDKMDWKNISDLKGPASDIANLYCVKSIPHVLLLDENNRILYKNLRGKKLEKKIKEILVRKGRGE
ncbi:MAG: thioredoxin-like domain-containing protein [Bacteroidales bacterium]